VAKSERHALLLASARRAAEVAAENAAAVDRDARFPHEAIAVLRHERLLGAAVPTALGGYECNIDELAMVCETLGRACTATAMVYAMHQIQVACILRHSNGSAYFNEYLREVAERQLLIASATSEVGVGGDLRSSQCAVESKNGHFKLEKKASTISYGQHADDILITARRSAEVSRADQVLVLIRRDKTTLEQTGIWDTLGMRGTCSPGFNLATSGLDVQILPDAFGDIAPRTMVPYSHVLWAAAWLGLASDAVSRARAFIRACTPATRRHATGRIAVSRGIGAPAIDALGRSARGEPGWNAAGDARSRLRGAQ
jgi:acyl-CoA dehydrogenase